MLSNESLQFLYACFESRKRLSKQEYKTLKDENKFTPPTHPATEEMLKTVRHEVLVDYLHLEHVWDLQLGDFSVQLALFESETFQTTRSTPRFFPFEATTIR